MNIVSLLDVLSPWMVMSVALLFAGVVVTARRFSRRGRRASGVPKQHSVRMRTRLIATTVVVAVLALLVGLVAALTPPKDEKSPVLAFLAPVVNGVIVLDDSTSVNTLQDALIIAGFLEDFAALGEDRHLGFVAFASEPVEMWDPSGEPELFLPFLRFFRESDEKDALLAAPWTAAIGGGTEIAPAIQEALDALERDGYTEGTIVLISDLHSFAGVSTGELVKVLTVVRDSPYTMRIIALAPQELQRMVYENVLGEQVEVLELNKDDFRAMLAARYSKAERGDGAGTYITQRSDVVRVLVWMLAGALGLRYVFLPRLPWSRGARQSQERRSS